MPLDPADEARDLLRAVRALVEWEAGIGDVGFPEGARPRAPSRLPVSAGPAPEQADAPHEAREPGAARLARLAQEAEACTACDLHRERTRTAFSRGRLDAELMMIGEGPGQQEDEQGVPFVGPAGQLLDKMIAAMGYARDDVYICNVVKCRPPNNRAPSPAEAAACRHFLDAQIDVVRPKLIIALGRSAAERLGLVPETGRWQGEFGEYRGVSALSTFHPAYLLRSPEQKRVVWADLKRALHFLGKTPPG
jgi:uracil-DNA glycosylase